jgi:hypothetical protein
MSNENSQPVDVSLKQKHDNYMIDLRRKNMAKLFVNKRMGLSKVNPSEYRDIEALKVMRYQIIGLIDKIEFAVDIPEVEHEISSIIMNLGNDDETYQKISESKFMALGILFLEELISEKCSIADMGSRDDAIQLILWIYSNVLLFSYQTNILLSKDNIILISNIFMFSENPKVLGSSLFFLANAIGELSSPEFQSELDYFKHEMFPDISKKASIFIYKHLLTNTEENSDFLESLLFFYSNAYKVMSIQYGFKEVDL